MFEYDVQIALDNIELERHFIRVEFPNSGILLLRGKVIHRPKDLGDIRGVSYIFPVLYHFGVIDMVDEELVEKMNKMNKIRKFCLI